MGLAISLPHVGDTQQAGQPIIRCQTIQPLGHLGLTPIYFNNETIRLEKRKLVNLKWLWCSSGFYATHGKFFLSLCGLYKYLLV